MERYRTLLKLDEIRSLYAEGAYQEAETLANSIKGQKIKDMNDLFLLASVYRKSGNYRLAKNYLHRVYEKKSSWRVLEELMDVCLAEKNPQEAQEYLKTYSRLSGGDPRNYIYEYRIGRQLHRPDEELLPVLQTLKAEEYTEKYAYELAKLYHRLGRKQECQNECQDLILWFGEGTYVERAKVLMAYYRGELSADDIHAEAERRIREGRERQARAMAERRANGERMQKEALEEEAASLEAVAVLQRTAEPEQQEAAAAKKPEVPEQREAAAAKKPAEPEQPGTTAVKKPAEPEQPGAAAAKKPEVPEQPEAAALQKTEISGQNAEPEKMEEPEEPMWAEDLSVLTEPVENAADKAEEGAVPAADKAEEAVTAAGEKEEYEQYSLNLDAPEEPVVLSQPKEELARRLSEAELTPEGSLHAFARMEPVRRQLFRMLEVMCFVRQKCCCLVITGERGSGKTTLAGYISRMFFELGLVKNKKIARIQAEKLNNMNLEERQEQLSGSCLIVENAGALKDEAARRLIKMGEKKGILGAVILEDNLNEINKLLRKSPDCNRVFGTRIHLPKYGEEELLCFAKDRILRKDYSLGEGVIELLRGHIAEVLRTAEPWERLARVEEYVGRALTLADGRIEGELLTRAKRGDFHDMSEMVVRKEDFV